VCSVITAAREVIVDKNVAALLALVSLLLPPVFFPPKKR